MNYARYQSPKISFTFFQVTIWGDYGRIEGKKVFMGVAQIMLDDLDLSNIVIGWYKLFGTSSLVSVPPSGPKMKPDGLKSSLESLKTESYGWVRFRQMLIFSNSTNTKSSDSRGLAWKKKLFDYILKRLLLSSKPLFGIGDQNSNYMLDMLIILWWPCPPPTHDALAVCFPPGTTCPRPLFAF